MDTAWRSHWNYQGNTWGSLGKQFSQSGLRDHLVINLRPQHQLSIHLGTISLSGKADHFAGFPNHDAGRKATQEDSTRSTTEKMDKWISLSCRNFLSSTFASSKNPGLEDGLTGPTWALLSTILALLGHHLGTTWALLGHYLGTSSWALLLDYLGIIFRRHGKSLGTTLGIVEVSVRNICGLFGHFLRTNGGRWGDCWALHRQALSPSPKRAIPKKTTNSRTSLIEFY